MSVPTTSAGAEFALKMRLAWWPSHEISSGSEMFSASKALYDMMEALPLASSEMTCMPWHVPCTGKKTPASTLRRAVSSTCFAASM